MKTIEKMSAQTREKLLRGSAQRLPDRPTASGMTPDDIRRTLWMPMLGSECSLATEQDRIVTEANAALAAVADGAAAALSEGLAAEAAARTEGLAKKLSLTALSVRAGRDSVAQRDAAGRLYTKPPSEAAGTEDRGDQAVSLSYLEERLSRDVTQRLDSLATAVAGKARGFVLEGWQALTDALSGRWEHGGLVYYTDELCTGDCLYLVDTELPDFWFEETYNDRRDAETVTDPESGETLTLRVLNYETGLQMGLLHVLESGVPLGDLSAALDLILGIQDSLIGGGA